jgi:hypothetical protein
LALAPPPASLALKSLILGMFYFSFINQQLRQS